MAGSETECARQKLLDRLARRQEHITRDQLDEIVHESAPKTTEERIRHVRSLCQEYGLALVPVIDVKPEPLRLN